MHYLNAEGIELFFDGLLANRWISELALTKDLMLKKKKRKQEELCITYKKILLTLII